MQLFMTLIIKYRNRLVTQDDISYIRKLISNHPEYGRCALSRQICRDWNWAQANGQLKDMVCRGLLLLLEKQDYIKLPPRKKTPKNPFIDRKPPEPVVVDQGRIEASIKEIMPITLQQVRRTPNEKLFNGLIEQYHYLGYSRPVGEHLKYLVFSNHRPIACLAFSSAAYYLGCRDSYIGWSLETRKKNLRFLVYNTRFLILPWVNVACLASHVLSKCTKVLTRDWQKIYNHPIYWMETIIDSNRFKGTCYRAANWILLGKTTGRGINDQTNSVNRSIKDVYGYPLVHDFKARLCCES